MQHNPPTTQIRQLRLQQLDLRLTHCQLQLNTIGSEVFFHDQTTQIHHPQLHQRQLGKAAGTAERHTADQLDFRRRLQTLVRAAAIGPGQTASAQLNAAIPADHQHRDLIAILRLNGCQNRPSGSAAGFAIVVAAVLRTEFPRPAVMRGIQVAVLFEERLRVSGRSKLTKQDMEDAGNNLIRIILKGCGLTPTV